MVLSSWGCLLLAAVAWHDRIQDRFLRSNLASVPLFVIAMLVVGFVIEVRIYGEVLPIVFAALWVVAIQAIARAGARGEVVAARAKLSAAFQSVRSAAIGSTRAARRAGT